MIKREREVKLSLFLPLCLACEGEWLPVSQTPAMRSNHQSCAQPQAEACSHACQNIPVS